MMKQLLFATLFFFLAFSLLTSSLYAFQSDELLVDDEEFGLEGAQPRQNSPDPTHTRSSSSPTPSAPTTTTTSRRKYSDPDSDSKIQFTLEHAFGDSDFVPAGTFSARLKTWSHGGQVSFIFIIILNCRFCFVFLSF